MIRSLADMLRRTLDQRIRIRIEVAPGCPDVQADAWMGFVVPARTPESDAMSKALQKAGFKFVGSTICYAFMQASGMVDDHVAGCHSVRE